MHFWNHIGVSRTSLLKVMHNRRSGLQKGHPVRAAGHHGHAAKLSLVLRDSCCALVCNRGDPHLSDLAQYWKMTYMWNIQKRGLSQILDILCITVSKWQASECKINSRSTINAGKSWS